MPHQREAKTALKGEKKGGIKERAPDEARRKLEGRRPRSPLPENTI